MAGHRHEDVVLAHADSGVILRPGSRSRRKERELFEDVHLLDGATRALGAGRRGVEETADPERTCFERDRDRVLHSSCFRRLAGKTQVFISPSDHQRTRLTHALEVAQIAVAICRSARLNDDLALAASLAHDCGHGPGGHPSEEVFSSYLEGGFDHAPWGADVVLRPLNLCAETLDAVRNHSWSRPAPATPEGEVVSWADRIAYVCHDWEDALGAGVVKGADLPGLVAQRCGTTRGEQISTFVEAVVSTIERTGRVGMGPQEASALAAFRRRNYELIYMGDASVSQARGIKQMLAALVEHLAARPELLPASHAPEDWSKTPDALWASVSYVAGMTDRFAHELAGSLLGWRDVGAVVHR